MLKFHITTNDKFITLMFSTKEPQTTWTARIQRWQDTSLKSQAPVWFTFTIAQSLTGTWLYPNAQSSLFTLAYISFFFIVGCEKHFAFTIPFHSRTFSHRKLPLAILHCSRWQISQSLVQPHSHSGHRFPTPSSKLCQIKPLKGHSLSPSSCPPTRSAPSERFGYW